MFFNASRALAFMERHELDAIVATSPFNITYVSGYYCWLDPLFKEYMTKPGTSSNLAQMYAIFPREGEPALVADPLLAVNAADLWIKDLYGFGNDGLDHSLPPALPESDYGATSHVRDLLSKPQRGKNPTDALLAALADRGLQRAQIGVEMEGLPLQHKAALADGLPDAQFKDCTNLIRLIRMVKTPDEIASLARAAEIAENAALETVSLARPGASIQALVRHFMARIAQDGAEFDHYAYGVNGLGIATETRHTLTTEFVEYVDFGCKVDRYFSDSGFTLATQPPSRLMEDRYAAMRDSIEAALAIARPGVKASALQAAMAGVLRERAITASFPHGHGVGLEPRDYPIIVPDNGLRIRDDCVEVPSDLPLEENMVINLEAPIFMPGIGSAHVERTFVVTAGGIRPLIPQDRTNIFYPH